jgi:hypothetical protein
VDKESKMEKHLRITIGIWLSLILLTPGLSVAQSLPPSGDDSTKVMSDP